MMNLHDQIAYEQQKEAENRRLEWWAIRNDPELWEEIRRFLRVFGYKDPWRVLAAIEDRAMFWAKERMYASRH